VRAFGLRSAKKRRQQKKKRMQQKRRRINDIPRKELVERLLERKKHEVLNPAKVFIQGHDQRVAARNQYEKKRMEYAQRIVSEHSNVDKSWVWALREFHILVPSDCFGVVGEFIEHSKDLYNFAVSCEETYSYFFGRTQMWEFMCKQRAELLYLTNHDFSFKFDTNAMKQYVDILYEQCEGDWKRVLNLIHVKQTSVKVELPSKFFFFLIVIKKTLREELGSGACKPGTDCKKIATALWKSKCYTIQREFAAKIKRCLSLIQKKKITAIGFGNKKEFQSDVYCEESNYDLTCRGCANEDIYPQHWTCCNCCNLFCKDTCWEKSFSCYICDSVYCKFCSVDFKKKVWCDTCEQSYTDFVEY
jgi:hypothetical protein